MLMERIRGSRGLRTLVGLAVMALCAGLLSSCSFSSKKTIYAEFQTAAGLFVGNDVGVLGVPVGTVTEVKPEGSYVLVKMSVNSDQPVSIKTSAVVVSRSVATDRYVELAGAYDSGPQMPSAQRAPSSAADCLNANGCIVNTSTPVEFDQVLTTIGTLADQISGSGSDKDAIQRFLSATSNTLGGRGQLINQAIKSLGSAVNGVSQQRDNATSTLVALDGLTSKLATNQDTIKAFVQQVSRATALLAAERNNFRDAISSATKMINVVAQFAKDNRAQITQAVNQTNDELRTVNAKSSQVAEILRLLPLATQNLQRAINGQNELVVRLDISALVPVLGPLVQSLCKGAAASLCDSLGIGSLLDPLGAATSILKGL